MLIRGAQHYTALHRPTSSSTASVIALIRSRETSMLTQIIEQAIRIE
jgi:hypothetical protein